MGNVKIGIIGVGSMGKKYVQYLDSGEIKGAELSAVCVRRKETADWVRDNTKNFVKCHFNEDAFFADESLDAVLIATPHYSHPDLAMKAFQNKKHVLVEKPAGVFAKNIKEMNEAAKASGKIFGIIYNQRTNPVYQKLRSLIQSGELGEIKRTNWIITDIYRSQSYYDSNSWRATWSGEGGGVLINQAVHELDIWLWTVGMMPKRVRAFASFGKYHNIETEDDVTAYFEYENGATGVIIATTGEAPGTNRFEIAGNRGKIVVENGELSFYRLTQSERDFNATYKGGFGKPECWKVEVPIDRDYPEHIGIIQNFTDAILKGAPLLAPGEDGLNAMEVVNAVYLSSWLNETVEIPVNADFYYEKLQEKVNQSSVR